MDYVNNKKCTYATEYSNDLALVVLKLLYDICLYATLQ